VVQESAERPWGNFWPPYLFPKYLNTIRHVGSRNPALLGLGRVLVWGLRRQADVSELAPIWALDLRLSVAAASSGWSAR
jgi:hypothetical protein